MDSFNLSHMMAIQSNVFYATLMTVALWEIAAPRRILSYPLMIRWLSNIGIAIVNMMLKRWVIPALTVSLAFVAAEYDMGFIQTIPMPTAIAIIVTLLAMDLFGYFVHRILHHVPLLWRLHLVHHADLDFDFTTGLRHHPFEFIVLALCRFAFIIALGAPPAAIILFEILHGMVDTFNHGNIYLPKTVDRVLRLVIVTPDMHRVHHSATQYETDSNFCSLFPWWDHMFGTYRAQPEHGHLEMTPGLDYFRDPRNLYLDRLLTLPFYQKA